MHTFAYKKGFPTSEIPFCTYMGDVYVLRPNVLISLKAFLHQLYLRNQMLILLQFRPKTHRPGIVTRRFDQYLQPGLPVPNHGELQAVAIMIFFGFDDVALGRVPCAGDGIGYYMLSRGLVNNRLQGHFQ